MDDDKGSLTLENSVVNAKYLLIRESGNSTSSRIFKIISDGPKVYKGTSLNGYKSNNLKDYYQIFSAKWAKVLADRKSTKTMEDENE